MFLFIIRRYNDIDHIVPIIYRMAKDGFVNIKILCTNFEIDIKKDYRLKFLLNNYNISTENYFLFNYVGLKQFLIINFAKIINIYKNNINHKSNFVNKLLAIFYKKRVIDKYYNQRWASNIINRYNPKVVIFDWQKPKFFLLPFINELKNYKIPLLVVPHGMNVASNELITKKAVSLGRDQNFGEDWESFDFAVTQFESHKERIAKNGFDEKYISVLGSTRFCDEWLNVLKKIKSINQYKCNKESGKINVIYMDHRLQYRFYPDIVIKSINKLANLSFINLIVKPTTGQTHKSGLHEEQGVLNKNNSPNIIFEKDTSSNELIEWSDVVINTISSIGIEALIQDKILIHPQFFHENKLIYSDLKACWTVNSHEEIESALKKINLEPNYKPYKSKDVKSFMDYVIYGGLSDKDVLGNYKEFILSKVNSN